MMQMQATSARGVAPLPRRAMESAAEAAILSNLGVQQHCAHAAELRRGRSTLRLGCEAQPPARRLLHRHERILRRIRVR